MPKRTRDYQSWLLKNLSDPIVAGNYLRAGMTDSKEMFLVALRNVAEAHRVAKVASRAKVSRESLYRMLSRKGNPTYKSLASILRVVGLKLTVEPVVSLSSGRRNASARQPAIAGFAKVEDTLQKQALATLTMREVWEFSTDSPRIGLSYMTEAGTGELEYTEGTFQPGMNYPYAVTSKEPANLHAT